MTEWYTYRVNVINQQTVRIEVLNAQNETVDQGGGVLRYEDARRQQIEQLITMAIQSALTQVQIETLGETLFDALFDPVLRQNLVTHYNDIVHTQKKLLRLELDVDETTLPHVAKLPWEFMRLPKEANLGVLWLASAPDFIFSRRRLQWFIPRPIQLQRSEKLKIGLVAATPDGLPPVNLAQIQAELQKLSAGPGAQFELLPPVLDADALKIEALLTQEPHIMHFVGYGRLREEDNQLKHQIAFVGQAGDVEWVSADFFSDLLNQHRPPVVMLQACVEGEHASAQAFAGLAAAVVAQNVPVVVATQYQMNNLALVRFAMTFYQHLADGDPVDRAVQVARRGLALQTQYKTAEFASPLLYMRVNDGRLFHRQSVQINRPESVQQAQKLRQVLVSLNYKSQRSQSGVIHFRPKMSAFLISGPNQLSGQRWLLNLLVKEDLKDEFAEGVIDAPLRLDIAQALTSQDVSRLWAELADKLRLPWGSSQEEIIESLHEMWQDRDVLIILDNVSYPGTEFPKLVLQQVWRPLVERFKPRLDSNWCLLFMVDNEGKLAVEGQEDGSADDPVHPVWLTPLKARFEAEELGTWLGMPQTVQALTKARLALGAASPQDLQAKLLARTDNGVPMVFVKELCRLCDHNWGELEGKWLTL